MVISDNDIEILVPALDAYITELEDMGIGSMPIPPWAEEALVKAHALKGKLLHGEDYEYN